MGNVCRYAADSLPVVLQAHDYDAAAWVSDSGSASVGRFISLTHPPARAAAARTVCAELAALSM